MAVVSEAEGGRAFPRLHWSALFAGVFVAIAAHIVLGLVGAALGFAAEPADSAAVGAAAAIWALITPFVATLLGAWLACRMAGADDDRRSASVHAVLVWCIGLIAGAIFLTGTLATGAMATGTATSGNLGAAQRVVRGEPGTARPAERPGEARAEDAARRAAATAGGAALAAIAGLLGAVVAAGIATRRREGQGLGWRIAIQRRGQGRGAEEHRRTPAYGAPASRVPGAPGTPEAGPSTDPYHH